MTDVLPRARGRARAVARPLSGSRGLRRARRRPGLLRGLRRRRADDPAAADVVDRPLAPLEGADPVPGAALPRGHVRRARQREVRPPARRRGLPRARVRRRRARGDGRDRHRAGRAARPLVRGALDDAARRRPPRARAGRDLHRPGRPARARAIPSGRSSPASTRSSTTDEGWAKYNRHYWQRDYLGFLEFFFAQMFNEPHSTKQIEDCVGWALETDARDAGRHDVRDGPLRPRGVPRRSRRAIRCPVLVIHGDRRPDPPARAGRRAGRARPAASWSRSRAPATARRRATRSRSTCCCGTSSRRAARRASWTRGRGRRKRALFVSSPIGLGHARRDVAIAHELRALHPDLEIDWLAQHPVTRVLEAEGERIHPASAPAGQRVRPHRVRVRRARPALLPGLAADGRDPGRELHGLPRPRHATSRTTCGSATRPGSVDYFLHENPELKRAAYVWLTDFVGWLPVDGRGAPDRRLQRRDDRAHRSLPARARPRDLRRQPRRRRRRALRPGPAGDPRLDRAALRLRRLRHRLRPRRRPRAAARRARLPARTSRCASSPSAARASAPPCCGA